MTTDPDNIYTQTPPNATTLGYWMSQAANDYPRVTRQIIQSGIDATNAFDKHGADGYSEILCTAWRKIVKAIDEYRRDTCMNCRGRGSAENSEGFLPCKACAPFADGD